MNFQIRAARLAMRALEYTAPTFGGAFAERLFFTPPRSGMTPQVRELLATARPFRVCLPSGRVAAWAWGSGPAVILAHGWGGRGGRLAAAYVAPLVASGFTAVTFDAPGHGVSDGKLSSMPEFARGLMAVAAEVGSPFAVIAHSMGGAATGLAMSRGMRLERAVFIAPASGPAHYVEQFAGALTVGPSTMAAMRRRSERRIGFRWSDLYIPNLVARFDVPLLVMHDQDDPTVPFTEGAAIAAAWPGAELVPTKGLGHREVVRDPAVVARAVDFVRQGEPAVLLMAPRCAVSDEDAWVGDDLYQRDGRRRRLFGISDTD